MGSLLWQLVDRSSETEFIFALFHLLLAGLALLILLRWLGRRSQQLNPPARLLLTIAFSLFALDFATTATYYGMVFFFDRQWNRLLFYVAVARPGMQRNDAQRRRAGGFRTRGLVS